MVKAARMNSWRRPDKMGGPLLLAFGVFYLVFHLFSGERGLYALLKENRKLEILRAELKEVQTKNAEMDRRVKAMNSGSLDLDMLDEQVRRVLGDASRNEVVIPTQNPAADKE